MPELHWSRKHGAYIKQCSRCKIVFTAISISEFGKNFYVNNVTTDKFTTGCKDCTGAINHGNTRVDAEEMLRKQNGKCALCMTPIYQM